MSPQVYAAFEEICRSEALTGRAIRLLAALTKADALLAGTVTLGEHRFPGDYYRFTEQAVQEVFLEGLVEPRCRWVMSPPRIIGWARMPLREGGLA